MPRWTIDVATMSTVHVEADTEDEACMYAIWEVTDGLNEPYKYAKQQIVRIVKE